MLYKRKTSSKLWMDFTMNGVRVNRSTKTDKPSIAKKVEAKAREDVLTMEFMSSPDVLLSTALDLAYEVRWSTTEAGEQSYQRGVVILGILGDIDINMIGREKLRFVRRQLSTGRTPITVNRYMASLRTILNECRKEGWLSTVPYFDSSPNR